MQALWQKYSTIFAVLSLGCISAVFHLLPFLLHGPHPLGYDTGFYRRYLTQPFTSFPNAGVPGLGNDALVPRVLFDLTRFLHIPADIALYGSYIFLFALAPILLYILLRPTLGGRGAWIAGALYIFSSVAYNAYWYMLWKGALGLDLLLLAYIALERRNSTLLMIVGTTLALSHKTSAIIFILSLGIFFILNRGKRPDALLAGALTAAVFFAANTSLVHKVQLALPTALFLEWPDYLTFTIPLLILLGFGIRGLHTLPIPKTILALALTSFIFPLAQLPFYQRIFIFCDLALVALAAFAVEYMLRQVSPLRAGKTIYLHAAALCIAGGLFLGSAWNQVSSLRPLLPQANIREIERIDTILPQDAYVLTTSDEAPWYQGWTKAHIIAPGLLWDSHNLEEWIAFWDATSTESKISFLNSFNKPLYVSTLGPMTDLLGQIPPCLVPAGPHLLYNSCP